MRGYTAPVALEFTAPSVSADDPLRPVPPPLDADPVHPAIPAAVGALALTAIGLATGRAVAALGPRIRRRRLWNAALWDLAAGMKDLDVGRGGDGREVAHAAARHLRRLLADAFDPRIMQPGTAVIGRLVLERTGDDSLATAAGRVVSALDAARFGEGCRPEVVRALLRDAESLLRSVRPSWMGRGRS